MVRYEDLVALSSRIETLAGRVDRFRAKGLESRIPGVLAELEATCKKYKKWHDTYKWQKEIYGD